jgi:hypothetical protein
VYGERLRRICRYLKAWRDHNRPHLDRVSSILLMVCAWRVFDDFGRPNVPERDDAGLLLVARRLPILLAGPVENPTDPEETVDARLDDANGRVAIAMAEGTPVYLKYDDPRREVKLQEAAEEMTQADWRERGRRKARSRSWSTRAAKRPTPRLKLRPPAPHRQGRNLIGSYRRRAPGSDREFPRTRQLPVRSGARRRLPKC